MATAETVQLLMATYNGSQFIAEQIKSLQLQTYPHWQLWIRDDLSTDSTPEINEQFARQDLRIQVVASDGKRLGACRNFAHLLQASPSNQYTMFCDQDDWWHANKIETMLQKMQSVEQEYGQIPLLIHADLEVVDAQLQTICDSFWKYHAIKPGRCTLNRLLVQNPIPGCAMLFNGPLREIAVPIAEGALMHDWWLVLVASIFGRIVPIDAVLGQYRQHGHNWAGAEEYNAWRALTKLLHFSDNTQLQQATAQSVVHARTFLDCYRTRLNVPTLRIIEDFVSLVEENFWGKRVKLVRNRFFRHGLVSTIGMIARI